MTLSERILKLAEANLVTPMKSPIFGGPNAFSKFLGRMSDDDVEKLKYFSQRFVKNKDKDHIFSAIKQPYYIFIGLQLDKQVLTENNALMPTDYSPLLGKYSNYSVSNVTIPSNYSNYTILFEASVSDTINTAKVSLTEAAIIQKFGSLIRNRSAGENIWYTYLAKASTADKFLYVSPETAGHYKNYLTEPWTWAGRSTNQLQSFYRQLAPDVVNDVSSLLDSVPTLSDQVKQTLKSELTTFVSSHITLKNSIKMGMLDAAGVTLRKRVSASDMPVPGAYTLLNSPLRVELPQEEQDPSFFNEMPADIWTFIATKLNEVIALNGQKLANIQDIESNLSASLKASAETVDIRHKRTLALYTIKFQSTYAAFKKALLGSNSAQYYKHTEVLPPTPAYFSNTEKQQDFSVQPEVSALNTVSFGKISVLRHPGWALSLALAGKAVSIKRDITVGSAGFDGIVGLITDDFHNQITTSLAPSGISGPAWKTAYFNSLKHIFATAGTISWHGDNLLALQKIIETALDETTGNFKEGISLCDGPVGFRHNDIKGIQVLVKGTFPDYRGVELREFEDFVKNSGAYPDYEKEMSLVERHLNHNNWVTAQYEALKFFTYVTKQGCRTSGHAKLLTLDGNVLSAKKEARQAVLDFIRSGPYTLETLEEFYIQLREQVISVGPDSTDLQPIADSVKGIIHSIKNKMFVANSISTSAPFENFFAFSAMFRDSKSPLVELADTSNVQNVLIDSTLELPPFKEAPYLRP